MSTSCATVGTEWLNPVGTRLASPRRNNHFSKYLNPLFWILIWKMLPFLWQIKESVLFFLVEGGKCELSRRGFTFKGIVAAGASVMTTSVVAEPSKG